MFDVAVVGAGMAGLVCAQQLAQAGYRVVVVEKSRGLGGRVATRRLSGTCKPPKTCRADHGLRYLTPTERLPRPAGEAELLQPFVEMLRDRHILELWTNTVYELSPDAQLPQPSNQPHYVAPAGMSAIAKFLAAGLEIRLSERVIAIAPTGDNTWYLTTQKEQQDQLTALAVVFAIPAPQALMLLDTAETGLPAEFLDNLRSVEFDPSFSVIAGYSPASQPLPTWKAVTFIDDPDLAWIGLDSSKRPNPQMPIFVVNSSATFAQNHLETQNLEPVGQHLLKRASDRLLSWLDTPDWMQVHRWRYAFPSRPLPESCLTTTELPLVCCGDWCGGNQVEAAMLSGLAAAEQINNQLRNLCLPTSFLETLAR